MALIGWLRKVVDVDSGVVSVNSKTGIVVINKTDIGLANVENVDQTNPANITQDATHRFATDTEKSTWNGKQDALGFTAVPNSRTVNGHALTADVTVSKTDVALGNVPNVDATAPANIVQDSIHRFATDAEKITWNAKQAAMTITAIKTGDYTANINEFVPVNISAASVAITLPTAPADGSVIGYEISTIGAGKTLSIKAGGTDVFNRVGGSTTIYAALQAEGAILRYQASTKIWFVQPFAATSNFATGFPGIDATTPISNTDIAVDTTSLVMTITPPLGYFDFYVDGGGVIKCYRKIGAVEFPAFTDLSGVWYFYFDSTGAAVTTQTAWTTADFQTAAPVLRLLWNSTLVGAAKLVAIYAEWHENDIPADTHQWMHLSGAIWREGFTLINNALVSAAPDADGRNTVVALTTGSNVDDNLDYTVTNSAGGLAWQQVLGTTVAGSLNATNSALFQIFTQDSNGRVSFLPATRFPFPWNAGNNRPQYITTVGSRIDLTNAYFLVVFIYATQNWRTGEALKVVTAPVQFSSLVNARAYNYSDIQSAYSLFGIDYEIRPLYRLIFAVQHSNPSPHPAGCKYAVLRETADIRKTIISTSIAVSWSLPASSVVVTPSGNITATNVATALVELDTIKAQTLLVDDAAAASAANVGKLRYKVDANNSYLDMSMQTGAATYAWVNIKTNTW